MPRSADTGIPAACVSGTVGESLLNLGHSNIVLEFSFNTSTDVMKGLRWLIIQYCECTKVLLDHVKKMMELLARAFLETWCF